MARLKYWRPVRLNFNAVMPSVTQPNIQTTHNERRRRGGHYQQLTGLRQNLQNHVMSNNIGCDNIGQVTYWRQSRRRTNLRHLLGISEMTVKFTIICSEQLLKGLKRFSPILITLKPVDRSRNFELKHTCILESKYWLLNINAKFLWFCREFLTICILHI